MEHLLALIADAEVQLRAFGVLRSGNLVGDLAEHYACERLGLARAPASQRGYDATDSEGGRVQIKGIRLPNRQIGVLRDLDRPSFDRLAVVVLGERYEVRKLIKMSREQALARAVYRAHVRGWTLTLSTACADDAGRLPDTDRENEARERTDTNALDAMRDRIVRALQQRLSVTLMRYRRTLFQSADGGKRACFLVSKRYESGHQAYWYGYHPVQHEFLKAADEAIVVLGCIDRNEAFAIPFSIIGECLPKLNQTIRESDKSYWHVFIATNGDGGQALYLPKTGEKRDLRPFAFALTRGP